MTLDGTTQTSMVGTLKLGNKNPNDNAFFK